MEGEAAAAAATQTLPLPGLPHEIELQILLRLPVKSQLRFGSVSKQWLSSISDPKFINSHHHRAKTRYDTILCKRSHGSLFSLGHDGCVQKFDRFVPNPKTSDDAPMFGEQLKILGVCNGLLFGFTAFDEAYCWNPSTGKHVRVGCSANVLVQMEDSYHISGLGYNSSTGDYKAVVSITYVSPPGSPPSDGYDYGALCAYILSFKTRTWKQVGLGDDGHCPYGFFSGGVGTVLDGNPHWAVKSSAYRMDSSRFLIYFDVIDDHFKVLPPPPSTETDSFISDLGVLGGRELCVFITRTPDSSTLEVWAMKEYGVQESWVPLFDIPLFSAYLRPLCFTSSNKVLLTAYRIRIFPRFVDDGDLDEDEDEDLFLYDPKAGATKKIMIPTNSSSPPSFYPVGYAAFALEDSFEWIGEPTSAAWTSWASKSSDSSD